MSIFKFTDISFDKNPYTRPGDSRNNLVGGKYNSNTLRYPIDLGSYDKGHYMVIHINEQNKTSYKGVTGFGDEPSIISNRRQLNSSVGGTGIGGLDSVLSTVSNFAQKATDFSKEAISKIEKFERQLGIGNIPSSTAKAGQTAITEASSYCSYAS